MKRPHIKFPKLTFSWSVIYIKKNIKTVYTTVLTKIKKIVKYIRANKKKVIKRAVLLTFFLFILSIVTLLIFFKYIDNKLPSINELNDRSQLSTVIYDRNGVELFRFFSAENRQHVEIDEIPEYLKWSILAAEDAKYYEHNGFDLLALTRCVVNTLTYKVTGGKYGIVCGASTITQQVVRNTVLEDFIGEHYDDRSISRKLIEILISYRLEQKYSKDEILQIYINEVPLGGLNYGVEAGSISIFGKS